MSYRIGVIYCSYGTPEMLSESLAPWISARMKKLGGNDFVICAISAPKKNETKKDELIKELIKSNMIRI